MPVERDDHLIHSALLEEQPSNEFNLITAFNVRILIQRCSDLDSEIDLSKGLLAQALDQCKAVLSRLSPHLTVHSTITENGVHKAELETDAPRDPASLVPADNERDPSYRSSLQHTAQSRDIFVNQLGVRMRIVQAYNTLPENSSSVAPTEQSNDPADLARVAAAGLNGMVQGQRQESNQQNEALPNSQEDYKDIMNNEQESLARDLLSALADISYVNFEPFDDHYVRSIHLLILITIEASFLGPFPMELHLRC